MSDVAFDSDDTLFQTVEITGQSAARPRRRLKSVRIKQEDLPSGILICKCGSALTAGRGCNLQKCMSEAHGGSFYYFCAYCRSPLPNHLPCSGPKCAERYDETGRQRYLEMCNEEARLNPIDLEGDTRSPQAAAPISTGPETELEPELKSEPEPQIKQETLPPPEEQNIEPVELLLTYLREDRENFRLHEELDEQLRALTAGTISGDEALTWVRSSFAAHRQRVDAAQKKASREATRRSTSRAGPSSRRARAPMRLRVLKVAANGHCVLSTCLAYRQSVSSTAC